jgi:hypothetical protein
LFTFRSDHSDFIYSVLRYSIFLGNTTVIDLYTISIYIFSMKLFFRTFFSLFTYNSIFFALLSFLYGTFRVSAIYTDQDNNEVSIQLTNSMNRIDIIIVIIKSSRYYYYVLCDLRPKTFQKYSRIFFTFLFNL